jgi:hypothetical protein
MQVHHQTQPKWLSNHKAGSSESFYYLEYLSESEAICKTTLARESGLYIVWWKKPWVEISWNYPFKLIRMCNIWKKN